MVNYELRNFTKAGDSRNPTCSRIKFFERPTLNIYKGQPQGIAPTVVNMMELKMVTSDRRGRSRACPLLCPNGRASLSHYNFPVFYDRTSGVRY